MIRLAKFFEKKKGGEPGKSPGDRRIAACAILLEIAAIDGEFSDAERSKITSLLIREFQIPENNIQELLKKSQEELDISVDLWQFTNQINQEFSDAEKLNVLKMLWKVVYADGVLEKHEDYLVHKLSTLLRVPHKEMIKVKLEVLEGKNR